MTLESIIQKLGFNPLERRCTAECEDDNYLNPYKDLSEEEMRFLFNSALADPRCSANSKE